MDIISQDVYRRLKAKGRFGESFSALINRLLDELDKKTEKEVAAS